MHMLEIVANLTNSQPATDKTVVLSAEVMQQSINAVKHLTSTRKDYDPEAFVSKINMSKIVDNTELSVSGLSEEVRLHTTLNSYKQVTPLSLYLHVLGCCVASS